MTGDARLKYDRVAQEMSDFFTGQPGKESQSALLTTTCDSGMGIA
jgi:hypothetical protein